ncbi:MAG: R3H domain-containing nucleic acid-binding protein [Pyrinomonadaceae bacterium]
MSEVAEQAEQFINTVFQQAGLELNATLKQSAKGQILNIKGEDSSLLLNEGGELLDAMQHLVNQAYGRKLPDEQRFICDVENFRATREAELHAMAHHAANQVRKSGVPFTFGAMNSNERRVIHTVLAEEEDISTESVGDGANRRLKINLK